MNRTSPILLIAIACALSVVAKAEIPNSIPHQGRLVVSNVNFRGMGEFKFLLFEDSDANHANGNEVALWANNSNVAVAFAEPGTAVRINVRSGLYSTHLGGAGMAPLPGSIEPSAGSKLFLRIWFDPATGTFQPLIPDIEFSAVPMALHARGVTDGGVDSAALADGAVTAAKLADGAVNKLGTPDGSIPALVRATDDGTVGVGTSSPAAGLHVATGVALLVPEAKSTLIDGVDGFDFLDGAISIASSSNLIAIASREDSSVTLVDISDPMLPVLQSVITDGVGGFDKLGGTYSVTFDGNVLAIAGFDDDSVTLVDTTDPTTPNLINVFTDGVAGYDKLDGPTDVEFNLGGQLVVSSGLDSSITLIDDPAGTPSIVVTLEDGQFGFDDLAGARAVAFNGSLLAVAAMDDDAVSLIDMSVPTNPMLKAVMKDGVGPFSELDGASAVDFSGGLLAIGAAQDGAVTLVDIGSAATNPSTILLSTMKDDTGEFDSLGGTRSVVFSGSLLAVAARIDDALTLIDTSDPANPVIEARFRDGDGSFNQLDGAYDAVFSAADPDILLVTAFADDSVTIIDTSTSGTAGLVVDDWIGVGTGAPQAALHVRGGLIIDNPDGLIDLTANQLELGVNTSASGDNTFASGRTTTASGDYSTAMGRNTIASGDYSFSIGRGTLAPSGYEVALGRYNTDYTPAASLGWDDTDRLFVIGNGTGLSARSDLLSIYKDGLFDLDGSADISGDLDAGGTINAAGEITSDDDIVATGDFKYSSPKTHYLQIPATSFDADYFDFDFSNYVRNSDGSIHIANASSSMSFFAGVQLPEGATVTQVEFAYKDNSGDQDFTDMDFHLKRVEFGHTSSVNLAAMTNRSTSGQSSNVFVATDFSILSGIINNQLYHYYLQVDLEVGLARSQLTFNGVRITYTTTKVAP
ncbi:MAG: hypothetical protein ACI8XO_003507 [Verrucomicrobiales bacterium]|jgi:hypothetical protein